MSPTGRHFPFAASRRGVLDCEATLPTSSEMKMQKRRLSCENALHNLLPPPPPPLTPASLKHHSEVWQQVGDLWQVALIFWLGTQSAWQWRTCVHFRISPNLSDPIPSFEMLPQHILIRRKISSQEFVFLWLFSVCLVYIKWPQLHFVVFYLFLSRSDLKHLSAVLRPFYIVSVVVD